MSLARPILVNRHASIRQGVITQSFLGSYYRERVGYVDTSLTVDKGKRQRFTGSHYREDVHLAIDYSAMEGSHLYAAHDGKIIGLGTDASGGKFLYLRVKTSATKQLVVMYYHMSGFAGHSKGDTVRRNDLIGYSGNSGGTSTGGHLHFELMKAPRWWTIGMMYTSAMRYDPQPFIDGKALGAIL